ncbi:MAG: helix-turn-helix domain-containing protein [Acidobacteriota bacterium]
MPKQKWFFNERIDDEIRRIYLNGSRGRGRETLAGYAKRIQYPYSIVQLRAGKLEISSPYSARPVWSMKEDEILRRGAQHSYQTIWRRLRAAGFNRSLIAVRRKVTNAGSKQHSDMMSGSETAQCFGVSDATVYRWIKKGLLKARLKDNAAIPSPQCHFLVHDNAIRDFVQRHPMEFDLRRVDQLWFLNLIFEDRLGAKDA